MRNPNTTGKDTAAILLYGLIALSALLLLALISPWLPTLDGRPTMRLLLPILVACVGIPIVAALEQRRQGVVAEKAAEELDEYEAWARSIVYPDR